MAASGARMCWRLGGRGRAREARAPMTDTDRERLIESYRTILELAVEREWKDLAASAMARLIKERSPAQVERMERERGLRAS